MSRFQNLLCFTILLATVTFFNVALAHVKIILALPQTGGPISVGDVEPYTVKVVSTFVADLEKECAKTKKVRHFFEKVNAFSECVCSVSKVKDRESHMKAKAGSLFQAISALGSDENGSKGGKVSDQIFCIFCVDKTNKVLYNLLWFMHELKPTCASVRLKYIIIGLLFIPGRINFETKRKSVLFDIHNTKHINPKTKEKTYKSYNLS